MAVSRSLRRFWPLLVGCAVLALLLYRVPLAELRTNLRSGPWLALILYTLPLAVVNLLADAWAMGICLAVAGAPRPFRPVLLVRGAGYLLGLVNYALGPSGFVVYLRRTGVPALRGTGIVFLSLITTLGALFVTALAGLPAVAGTRVGAAIVPLVLCGVAGLAVYLVAVAVRPRFLARHELLAPFFDAGPRGTLAAIAARVPHVLTVCLGMWGALRVWGVHMPFDRALALTPPVLLAGALPVSPAGLGTMQAVQILLFSPYAAAATAAGREAAVFAFSLAFGLLGLVFQALTGLVCLALLRRDVDATMD